MLYPPPTFLAISQKIGLEMLGIFKINLKKKCICLAACILIVDVGSFFSCGMQTLSRDMWNLIP